MESQIGVGKPGKVKKRSIKWQPANLHGDRVCTPGDDQCWEPSAQTEWERNLNQNTARCLIPELWWLYYLEKSSSSTLYPNLNFKCHFRQQKTSDLHTSSGDPMPKSTKTRRTYVVGFPTGPLIHTQLFPSRTLSSPSLRQQWFW